MTVLLAMIYHSESIQSKTGKGKAFKVQSGGKSATSFYESFPNGVAQDVPDSASNV